MPGLLQSTDSGVASFKFVAAFFAELIGVLIFTLYGSAVASTYGPWGNGITLAVLGRSRSWISETRHLRPDAIGCWACCHDTSKLCASHAAVYLTANVSGGHLNPAVTIATMVRCVSMLPRLLPYDHLRMGAAAKQRQHIHCSFAVDIMAFLLVLHT